MVSLRDGTQIKATAARDGREAAKASSPGRSSTRKRKSDNLTREESETPEADGQGKRSKTGGKPDMHLATEREDKQNERPQTPPEGSPKDFPQQLQERNQKTPGRVGPVKKRDFDLEPQIHPFKGEPGHKVRKSAAEKEEEYTQFIREHEGHPFHELHVCYDKGPDGSPTYDKAGFELDYNKVVQWMKPVSRQSLKSKKHYQRIDEKMKEEARKREIFFVPGEAPDDKGSSPLLEAAWTDRVSKDLQIPYHKVGVAEFEEWERRGFPKARRGEYSSLTKEELDRLMRLTEGAALRK
ncbi:hypothetical protein BU26DRAFT_519506 [Trematosphaeria pertusa]|uniref:Uncharacterized protein n=1 Tax=Trematosphaeria pertusa TaxID=390896 RepID=A0A6A6IGB3_9PLEO|nr:uncharacterized protein BU26DRAFT_519506 [Trematosphaeria pertusa]KAF2249446.1 hypothetical protein BU26DRAFT_519506 [Trematosphaeria pertusa]